MRVKERFPWLFEDEEDADHQAQPNSEELGPLPYENTAGADPAVLRYHRTTIALLRKYLRMSLELGQLPSLIGREFFRAKVSSYHTKSFEDIVIFTHDVERCLSLLPGIYREVIAKLDLQEHTLDETASMLGCSCNTVMRYHRRALDKIARIFVDRKIMEPIEFMPEDLLKDAFEEELKESWLTKKKPVRSVKKEEDKVCRA